MDTTNSAMTVRSGRIALLVDWEVAGDSVVFLMVSAGRNGAVRQWHVRDKLWVARATFCCERG